MKFISVALFIVAVFIWIKPASAEINPVLSPDTTSAQCQVLSGATNLKYFSFFGSSFDHLPGGSMFDEVKTFTNFTWVAENITRTLPYSDVAHNIAYFHTELGKARAAGSKAIVGGWTWDDDTWYNMVVPLLQPYYDSGTILGFYLVDDGWGSVSSIEANRRIQLIKQSFPQALTVGIFINHFFINEFSDGYHQVDLDWVGLEMYPRNIPEDRSTAYWQGWLDSAAQRMTPNQKFILVPGALAVPSENKPEDMAFMNAVLNLIPNNPRIEGIANFIWQSFDNFVGTRDLPNYRSKLTALGNCFKRTKTTTGDFNRDGKTDISIFRPSEGRWAIAGVGDTLWGNSADIPVPGDYNADGKTDLAVWRPSEGNWYIYGQGVYQWGLSNDIPVPGDYNADGKTDLAVWRPSDSRWYIKDIGTYIWGNGTDIPVPGDYNADGKTDIAVWRPGNGTWYVYGGAETQWGNPGDFPVPGDYNGDSKTDVAIWRNSDAKWYIYGVGVYQWGLPGDIPAPGDYDGDGKIDRGIWRPSDARWYVDPVDKGPYGTAGDIPNVNSVNSVILSKKLLTQTSTPTPTATISANPTSVTSGGSSILTWSSTNASSCTASGAWSGAKGTSGTQSVNLTSTSTYTITCGSASSSTTVIVASAPVPMISSFTANPTSISLGSSSTLTWSVSNATSMSLSQGIGTVTGTSRSVSPTTTTTYTLTATNSSGSSTATATVTVTSAPLPTISSFSASPTSISFGGSSTLSWTATNTTSISLDQGIGAVTGTSRTVSPTATTTYTLTATNSSGSVTSTTTVTVNIPPSVNISASPSSLTSGQSSILTWSSTNATSCTASGGWSGIGAASGNQTVFPTTTATYTITCTGPGGTTSPQSVTVTVIPPPAPTVSISVNPTVITLGQSTTLSWSSTNATSCTASGAWSGNGAVSGTLNFTPTVTSTYTLVCSGSGGSTNPTSATITVNAPPPLDFTLTNGGAKSVNQGFTVSNLITSTLAAGATASGVSFTASGLPTGAVGSFTSSTCTPTCTTTLTITTNSSTPVGSSMITVIATGSITKTSTFTLTVVDATAPVVTVTAPSTASGQISLTASASDNVGVVGVQFRLDGTTNIGSEDVTAPFTATWDTSTVSNATHTITAIARDAAGNQTTSSPVSVTVNNVVVNPPPPPPPLPTATISLSTSSITSGQSTTLTWSSTDATTISINQGIGTVASSGSRTITPTSTTTYSITVSNTTGSATQNTTLTVNPVVVNPTPTPTPTPTPPPPPPVVIPPATPTTPPPTTPPVIIPPATPPPSTPGVVTSNSYPSGTIFKYANNPTVYIKEGDIVRPITDWTVYQNQVPASRTIVTIPSTVTFSQGPVLGLRSGTLIKSSDNPTVYLIVNGKKQAFSSAQEFFNHNYNFSNVYTINDPTLVNSIETTSAPFVRPFGTLFKYGNSPAVYFLNGANQKRGYTTIEMFNIWNATLKDVITIPLTEQYSDGPIATLPNGIVVRSRSASTIYFVFDGQLRPFANMNLFYSMGFKDTDVKIFSDSDLNLHAIGNSMQ
jgi:hypothetical protein